MSWCDMPHAAVLGYLVAQRMCAREYWIGRARAADNHPLRSRCVSEARRASREAVNLMREARGLPR